MERFDISILKYNKMPHINVKVYDTQNNSFLFQQDVNVETFGDIKELIGFSSSTRYTNRDDKSDAFANTARPVVGDVTIFASASKSKAGC